MSTTLSLLTCVQQSSKAPLTSLQALAETMVDTRQSPGKGQRRSSRGMPPLPTQKKKTAVKHNKKKQPTSKQVAAAKEKTKQQEMEKNKPIEVKEEIMNSKRRLWTDEEDIAACKGYVNITCDPVAGAQQNKDEFWMRVTKKMYQFLGVDAEVADVHKPWSHQSVKTRITKTIGKQTQLFNGYYRACAKDNDSGWTKEMHMEAACNLFLETEGKPFKFSTCARILHQCPKFKPAEKSTAVGGEEEDGKPQAVANTVHLREAFCPSHLMSEITQNPGLIQPTLKLVILKELAYLEPIKSPPAEPVKKDIISQKTNRQVQIDRFSSNGLKYRPLSK